MNIENIHADLLRSMYTDALSAQMPSEKCMEMTMPPPSADLLRRMVWERVRSPQDRKELLELIDSDPDAELSMFEDAIYTCVDFALRSRLGVPGYARRGRTARMDVAEDVASIAKIIECAIKALEGFGIEGTPAIQEIP